MLRWDISGFIPYHQTLASTPPLYYWNKLDVRCMNFLTIRLDVGKQKWSFLFLLHHFKLSGEAKKTAERFVSRGCFGVRNDQLRGCHGFVCWVEFLPSLSLSQIFLSAEVWCQRVQQTLRDRRRTDRRCSCPGWSASLPPVSHMRSSRFVCVFLRRLNVH